MTVLPVSTLFGDAVAAVEEASLYGFSLDAAAQAAADHLAGADRMQAIVIASVLAGLVATTVQPPQGTTLDDWIQTMSAVAARAAT